MQEGEFNSALLSLSRCSIAEIASFAEEQALAAGNAGEEFYFRSAGEESRTRGPGVVGQNTSDSADGKRHVAEEGEFEFAFVTRDFEFTSTISADEIFHNGQIRPVFPVTDRSTLVGSPFGNEIPKIWKGGEIGPSLRKLLREEGKNVAATSSHSLEEDGLNEELAETNCMWRLTAAGERPCKRRSSAGSNWKKWKF